MIIIYLFYLNLCQNLGSAMQFNAVSQMSSIHGKTYTGS